MAAGPGGFQSGQYATVSTIRIIRTVPNGDIFVAETKAGDVRVFRGISSNGKPEQVSMFASGLNEPFGINFYPPGPNPEWVYIGNTDSVVRFPYQNGDIQARGPAQHIADVPGGGGHSTRDIQFSPDGSAVVSVVVRTSTTDLHVRKNRPMFWVQPDGSDYAFSRTNRNCVGWRPTEDRSCARSTSAIGRQPGSITSPCAGRGFLGAMVGTAIRTRHAGKHPESKTFIVPDVLNPRR
jgi:glucose/arabinose dehydrogenase